MYGSLQTRTQSEYLDQQMALKGKPVIPETFQGIFKIIGENSKVNVEQVKILYFHYICQSKGMDLGERNIKLMIRPTFSFLLNY